MSPRARDRLNRIASHHGVTWQQVCGDSRKHTVVKARVEFWRWLRDEGLSLRAIGRITGHHHTTVLHGIGASPPKPPVIRSPKPKVRPASEEGLRIVEAHIAALRAKHQRELAQRY